jgi:hypothetical protein
MITVPSAAHSFGNSSKPQAFNQATAPKTGPTGGNAPHPLIATCHPDLSCCCTPSPNDSDGKPNTPPPNSPPTAHHATKSVRQAAIKQRE